MKNKIFTNHPVYILNTEFGSFNELRDLVLKSMPAEKKDMIERINRLGKIRLAVISGVFINKENLSRLQKDNLGDKCREGSRDTSTTTQLPYIMPKTWQL